MDTPTETLSAYLPNGRVQLGQQSFTYFGGTNYLGTVQAPELLKLLQTATQKYGLHISISRASNSAPALYAQADAHVAQWLHAQAGLVFSSGFTACQILLKIVEEAGYTLLYAPKAHPANCRTIYDRHDQSLDNWRQQLKKALKQTQRLAVYYKPIDPIYLEPLPREWLNELPKEVLLILDDSHSLGVQGCTRRWHTRLVTK